MLVINDAAPQSKLSGQQAVVKPGQSLSLLANKIQINWPALIVRLIS